MKKDRKKPELDRPKSTVASPGGGLNLTFFPSTKHQTLGEGEPLFFKKVYGIVRPPAVMVKVSKNSKKTWLAPNSPPKKDNIYTIAP